VAGGWSGRGDRGEPMQMSTETLSKIALWRRSRMKEQMRKPGPNGSGDSVEAQNEDEQSQEEGDKTRGQKQGVVTGDTAGDEKKVGARKKEGGADADAGQQVGAKMGGWAENMNRNCTFDGEFLFIVHRLVCAAR
jgi:hypothetical protein